jgi:hemerythrin superfamily protein
MDIFHFIKNDHQEVKNLFQKIMASTDHEESKKLFAELKNELLIHSETEEKTFYQALQTHSLKDNDLVQKAKKEHQHVELILNQLSKLTVAAEKWFIQFGELKQMVEHHIAEEETEMFSRAKKCFSEHKAKTLAEEMQEMKNEAYEGISSSVTK